MKMKAAILYEPNKPMRVEEVTIDDPQDHEVMVKLVATGICHSDLLLMKGEVPTQYPVVAGHEGAGIVEKVGRGVVSVKPGDHVVLPGHIQLWEMPPVHPGPTHPVPGNTAGTSHGRPARRGEAPAQGQAGYQRLLQPGLLRGVCRGT